MESAPPMIPLVLELEKQAADLVAAAHADADAARADATRKVEAAAAAFKAETATQVTRIEEDAARVRENEVNKLRSAQATELAAIRDLPTEKLASGVRLVLDRLRETQA